MPLTRKRAIWSLRYSQVPTKPTSRRKGAGKGIATAFEVAGAETVVISACSKARLEETKRN